MGRLPHGRDALHGGHGTRVPRGPPLPASRHATAAPATRCRESRACSCLGGTAPSGRPSALATPFPQEHLHLWRQEGVRIRARHGGMTMDVFSRPRVCVACPSGAAHSCFLPVCWEKGAHKWGQGGPGWLRKVPPQPVPRSGGTSVPPPAAAWGSGLSPPGAATLLFSKAR